MIGQLSPGQARYAVAVSSGTGLDPLVVRSWIGAESGWNTTKAGHNYLNVGPGMRFPSTEHAAAKVVELIRSSRHYGGIRAAIPAGPLAQVRAIQESPWDAGHYAGGRLEKVYRQLAAAGGAEPVGLGHGDVPPDLKERARTATTDEEKRELLEELKRRGGGRIPDESLGRWFLDQLNPFDDILDNVLATGLALVFTVAALALMGLGLYKLTGTSPAAAVSSLQGLMGPAGAARSLAARAAA